jgi:hypothetical protein
VDLLHANAAGIRFRVVNEPACQNMMKPAGETTYRVGWNQTFEQLEDPCGGLISWSAEAVT